MSETKKSSTYPHLRRWTMPRDYFGASWLGYYVFLGRHRDSDALTRSNFTCGLEQVVAAAYPRSIDAVAVQVVCETHWAVGWVEWIAIHHSAKAALKIAEDIAAGLEDYPAVNEDHWSRLEWTETCDYWASLPIRARVDLCRENGESVFAARRECPPERVYEQLRDA